MCSYFAEYQVLYLKKNNNNNKNVSKPGKYKFYINTAQDKNWSFNLNVDLGNVTKRWSYLKIYSYLLWRNLLQDSLVLCNFLEKTLLTTLTLSVPIPDGEKKLNSTFIFTFLCGASKGFIKTFFPHSDWIQRDTLYLSVFSPNGEKMPL